MVVFPFPSPPPERGSGRVLTRPDTPAQVARHVYRADGFHFLPPGAERGEIRPPAGSERTLTSTGCSRSCSEERNSTCTGPAIPPAPFSATPIRHSAQRAWELAHQHSLHTERIGLDVRGSPPFAEGSREPLTVQCSQIATVRPHHVDKAGPARRGGSP